MMRVFRAMFVPLVIVAMGAVANGSMQLHYDFRGCGGSQTSYVFDSNPTVDPLLTVEVTAFSGVDTQEKVHQSYSGLGVHSYCWDDTQIDGFGPDETLLLTFGEEIQLDFATVTLVSDFGCFGDDDVRILIDGQHLIDWDPDPIALAATFTIDFAQLGLSVDERSGETLGFTIIGPNDDYKLACIDITAERDGIMGSEEEPVVPEPASLVIWSVLGAGAIGLGGLRRRKRTSWPEENRQAIRQIIDRGRRNA